MKLAKFVSLLLSALVTGVLWGTWFSLARSNIGGMLEMANARLYRFWDDLGEALRSGAPQNELKDGGRSMFETLYAEPVRLEQFMDAMSGLSAGNFGLLAERFDFRHFATLADIGGATGQLARIEALISARAIPLRWA